MTNRDYGNASSVAELPGSSGHTPRPPVQQSPGPGGASISRAATHDLWQIHAPGLMSFFVRRVASREEAEDLVSETILAAIQQMDVQRGSANPLVSSSVSSQLFRAYLYGIAQFKLNHWLRSRAGRRCTSFVELRRSDSDDERPEEQLPASPSADPLAAVLTAENDGQTCLALAGVGLRSPDQFKALLLHYMCDLSQKDAASVLGTRTETVNSRLQEGRRHMKKSMTDEASMKPYRN